MDIDNEKLYQRFARIFEERGLSGIPERMAPREREEVVRRAEAIAAGVFWYSKPWDMERCETPFELGEDPLSYDWNIVLNEDEEWCFMLNRMDYLEDLSLAYLIDGRVDHLDLEKRLLLAWIGAHPTIRYERSCRTLDTAIRIRSWLIALPCLVASGVASPDELARIVRSIEDQMSYLEKSFIPKYLTGNWGSIQVATVVEAYETLGLERDARYEWARTTLERQLAAQVYPDGVDWELSPMYHVEVELYLMGAYASLDRADPLKTRLRDLLVGMGHALAAQMLPGGSIDAQGDSDVVDVRPILALSAALLDDPELKFLSAGAPLSGFDLLHFGVRAADALEGVEGRRPASTHFDGDFSGVFTARSSWSDDANMTLFLNGPMGSSHGHADNLHVTCAFAGSPVFVDSGRFTYREDSPLRTRLKSAVAHNAVTVDGRSASAPDGSWSYAGFVRPLKTYVRHDGDIHYWEGAIVDSDPLAVIVRKLFFVERGIWACFDEVLCDGDHEMCESFHLDPRLSPRRFEGRAATAFELRPGVQFFSSTPSELEVEPMSQDYNKLCDHGVLRLRTRFAGKASSSWAVAAAENRISEPALLRADGSPVDPGLATTLRIEVSEDESYTFVAFHREAAEGLKAFECDGVAFHAKSVAIHTRGGSSTLHLLRG